LQHATAFWNVLPLLRRVRIHEWMSLRGCGETLNKGAQIYNVARN